MAKQEDTDRFFPEKLLRRLDDEHLARAELLHTQEVLENGDRLSNWLRGEDVNEDDIVRSLRQRRGELMDTLDTAQDAADKRRGEVELGGPRASMSRRRAVGLADIGIYWPFGCAPSEGTVPVPLPLQGPSTVPPAGDNASGQILTLPTSDPWEAMEPHYVGTLRKRFSFPFFFRQSYWLRNWRWVIPFPCAPCDSVLSYRVYVECGGAFSAAGFSAGLWNWINVREFPTVSGGVDFSSVPDYEVWPLSASWPGSASFTWNPIWSGVTLEGSMSVKDGQAPVLAVLMGAIVGLAFGQFQVINAGFHPWEMQVFPPGGYPEPHEFQYHAKVHYRFTPPSPVIAP